MKLISKFILFIIFLLIFQLVFQITSFATSDNLSIGSPAAILMDASTGKILYEKNSHEKRFPASTTKIMTAILTVENCNLTEIATVSHNAVYSIPYGYSHANLVEGEELTIEQLLNVLLIPSANDAAVVLAEHIAGSVENFANMMNERAKELGCTDTHFVNPNGIHDDNHYTTAYDLALMGQYAMKNETIRNIVKKTQCSLPKTNKYNEENRIFNTTNDLLREDYSNSRDNYYYEYATGVKTGYTTEAGSCIIASAEKDNFEVVAVVLGAETTEDGYSIRYPDCKTLFEYAFNNYSLENILNENEVVEEIQVDNATEETSTLKVSAKDDIIALVNKNVNIEDIEPKIELNNDLKAPISAGETIGKVVYTIDDVEYSSDLIADSTVIKSEVWDILFKVCVIILVLVVLVMLLRPVKSNKKNKKKKSKNSRYKHLRI